MHICSFKVVHLGVSFVIPYDQTLGKKTNILKALLTFGGATFFKFWSLLCSATAGEGRRRSWRESWVRRHHCFEYHTKTQT